MEKHSAGADIYLLAISDSALYELDQHLQLEDELVLHLAGSVRMGCFKKMYQIIMAYAGQYNLSAVIKKQLPVFHL
jgi:hypothetical protein